MRHLVGIAFVSHRISLEEIVSRLSGRGGHTSGTRGYWAAFNDETT